MNIDQRRRRLLQGSAAAAAGTMLPKVVLAAGMNEDTNTEGAASESGTQTQDSTASERARAMSINTARFEHNGEIKWGVVRDDSLTIIPGSFPTTGEFISSVSVAELRQLQGETIAIDQVKILSPVTQNQRFVCQGANYRKHMIESGMNPDDKKFNMIFTKATSCMSPADTDIIRPKVCHFLDYEVELGIVLKKDITGQVSINDSNLHEYVAGITIVNDVSARDVQVPQMQFYKGKSFRTFGPIGPFLCLLDKEDMHYIDEMQLTLKVNGEVRQDDNTSDLVYRPGETLTELSGVHDFAPGDLLATGTPAGCALTVPSPAKQKFAAILPEATKWKLFMKIQAKRTQYLQPGDKIETVIRSSDGAVDLGVQRNTVVQG